MAIAVLQPAPAASSVNACALLTTEEIQSVQGVAVTEQKPSEETQGKLRFAQCVFAAADFTRSVSLALIAANREGFTVDPVHAYWEKSFRRPLVGDAVTPRARTRQKNLPQPILGLGEEAFWTGDARAGALYVRSGPFAFRISVGGVTEEAERIRRSTALARAALARLYR
jgi:hypothetical protein